MPRLLTFFLLALSAPAQAQWAEADVVRAASTQPEAALAAFAAANADADAVGVGRLPDPSVSFERQQLYGDGAQSQDQLRVGWRVPLSGVRGAERQLARFEAHLATWAAQEERARAVSAALDAFYEALAASERAETLSALGEVFDEAARRAEVEARAGERATAEAQRLRLEAALVRATRVEAESLAVRARARLAAWLAVESLPELNGSVTPSEAPPSATWEEVRERRIAALDRALEAASRARRHARRAAWPDLEVEAGWLRQRQVGGNGDGYVVAASLTLPIAERGQSARGRSEAATQLASLARATELRVRTELDAATAERALFATEHQSFARAREEAERVLRAALARHAAGEASFVEIVDARRLVVEVADRALALALALRRADLRLRLARGEWR